MDNIILSFSASWKQTFPTEDTYDGTFFNKGTQMTKVKMMARRGDKWFHGENEELDAQILELPYVGDDMAMFVLLPREKTGLAKLKSVITLDNLNKAIEGMLWRFIYVFLPKFKVESKYSLMSSLQSLGLKKVFSTDADLSGINGEKNLPVSKVLHKAVMEMNEEGSEAVAATAIMPAGCRSGSRFVPPEFTVDHPFLYLIRDKRNGAILFMGQVNSL